jgi:diguanylate cyclase (GGDEF)-like protein/PAS domain S-box-containing protein
MSVNPIHIGLMSPLSGPGSRYGAEIVSSARAACAEINAQGGILQRPLKIIIEDEGGTPDMAIAAALRLLNQECTIVIGNFNADARSSVLHKVTDPKQVLYLNYAFYEGSLFSRFFFHFGALSNQVIDAVIPSIISLIGAKLFFAANSYDEWSNRSLEAATHCLRVHGGKVVGQDIISPGTARLNYLLKRVEDSGADVFVPYLNHHDLIKLLLRYAEQPAPHSIKMLINHFDEKMAQQIPAVIRPMIYAANTYFMTINTAANQQYLQQLATINPAPTTTDSQQQTALTTHYGATVYSCVHMIAKSIQKAGLVESQAIANRLKKISYNGPLGSLRINPKNHHSHTDIYLAHCLSDGSFEILNQFQQRAPQIPDCYQRFLQATSAHRNKSRQSKQWHFDALKKQRVALIGVAENGRIEYYNRTVLKIWRFPEQNDLLSMTVDALWQHPGRFKRIIAHIKTTGEWQGQLTARTAKGDELSLFVNAEAILQTDGSYRGYTLSCVDQHQIDPLYQSPSSQILAIADVAVLATNKEGIIIEANRRIGELFGYRSEELLGRSIQDLIPPRSRHRHADYLHDFVTSPQYERRMGSRSEVTGYRKDRTTFPVEITISKFIVHDEWLLVATLRDITERKLAEEELVWQATHDALTELPNRALIHDRLEKALLRSKKQGHNIALLFIDLDGFKLINDTHGHAIGDELLKVIAKRLLNHVRPSDTVGRLGGDEFIILCDQVDKPLAVANLADRLNDLLREPIYIHEQRLFATASIGLAIGHGTTHNAEDMLRNADAAMYTVKEQGRDSWRFFTDELHEQARQRLDIANGLRIAIEQQELTARFQPILDIHGEQILGAELLLRWHTPEGEISPAHFIPIAEMNGSIIPIGKWVFQQACQTAALWFEKFGQKAPYVSVNVSPRQLNDDTLTETFATILNETGAQARHILLELTETALMTDVNSNLQVLNQLSELGLRIAVDDFGTGYSSLAQLLRMPVSSLKIDREFIDGIDKQGNHRAIVSAVCRMAQAMQLTVIAEGVENINQLSYLRDTYCQAVQGFYFFKPLSASEIDHVLNTSPASLRPTPTEN